jgi:hypothetical protein
MTSEAVHFRFEALAVPRDVLNVSFVSDRRHLTYNYSAGLVPFASPSQFCPAGP